MKRDAPFVVKRYASPEAWPGKTKRLSVAYQAYTLTEALDWCREVHLCEDHWRMPLSRLFIVRRERKIAGSDARLHAVGDGGTGHL